MNPFTMRAGSNISIDFAADLDGILAIITLLYPASSKRPTLPYIIP